MIATALTLLTLLIAPGPTNALLALAGAEKGLWGAARLIPAVVLSYAAVVGLLLLWGAPLLQALPAARPVLAGAAALWVARLALGLWRRPVEPAGQGHAVTVSAVTVTTLLNPKAFILGLVVLPGQAIAAFGLFAALVVGASLCWMLIGAGALRRAGRLVNRGSALWLAAISLVLAARALTL